VGSGDNNTSMQYMDPVLGYGGAFNEKQKNNISFLLSALA
jgi:hypothetical protein